MGGGEGRGTRKKEGEDGKRGEMEEINRRKNWERVLKEDTKRVQGGVGGGMDTMGGRSGEKWSKGWDRAGN